MDRVAPVSCVDSVAEELTLVGATALQAEGGSLQPFAGPPVPVEAESSWAPGRISDVVPTATGYLVIDALAGQLIRLSPSLERWQVLAVKGDGPGELGTPITAAVNPIDGSVLVLDTGPRVVHRFDSAGTYVDRLPLRSNARDLSVPASDRVWLVHHVEAMRLNAAPGETQPIAMSYSLDGGDEQIDWVATSDSLKGDRFNLAGTVPAETSAAGAFVAIYFATSGVVDLFEDGEHVRTIQVCVPPSVAAFYETQREAGYELGGADGRRPIVRERYFPLIADVRVDADGSVAILSGALTESGALHVDRFDSSGQSMGSVLLRADPLDGRYPSALRLDVANDSVIVGFDLIEGHIIRYEFAADLASGDQ